MIPLSDRVVDLEQRQVRLGDRAVRLTAREVELLAYLAARPGQVVSLDELHAQVWGHHRNVVSRAAYHCWRRLLPKLERDPSMPVHLHLVHGEGVLLRVTRPDDGTPLLGRQADLAHVDRTLAAHPYVTVVGPGGIGKSSLARAWLGAGAWCDARSAVDRASLVAAVAAGVGLSRDAPDEAVREHLVGPVVLDNLEQCVDAARALLEAWCDTGAVRVLCTSRVPLGGAREGVVRLDGLDLEAATGLLANRVGADPSDPDVRALAEALEGVPLAIELAAARARVLPVREVRRLLETRRLALLADPTRADRHASLEAVLRESWHALDTTHRQALIRLAPLVGGFTVAHLDALVHDLGLWAVDVLHVLIDRGWVHRDGEARYRLLEVTREFVRTRFDDPDDPDDADRRLVALFDRPPPARPVPLAHVGEGANLEAAVQVAQRHGWLDAAVRVWLGFAEAASETRLRSVLALGEALHGAELGDELRIHLALTLADRLVTVNRVADAQALLEPLELPAGSAVAATGQALRGFALHMSGDAAGGLEALTGAAALARSLGLEHELAVAQVHRASALRVLGRFDEARALYEELLRTVVPDEEPSLTAVVSSGLAVLVRRGGDVDRAMALLRSAIDQEPREGNLVILGLNLAQLTLDTERLADARSALDELAPRVERLGQPVFAGRLAAMQGQLALLSGDLDGARRGLLRALPIYAAGGNRRPQAYAHATLALIEARMGNVDVARAHVEAAWTGATASGPEGRARIAYRLGRAVATLGDDPAPWVARGDAARPSVVAPFLARERAHALESVTPRAR